MGEGGQFELNFFSLEESVTARAVNKPNSQSIESSGLFI